MSSSIQTKIRPKLTRSELNQLRESGRLPGIVFGRGRDNTMVHLAEKDFMQWAKNGESQIIQLQIEEMGTIPVLLENVQRDPLTRKLVHIDFLQVRMDEKVRTKVSVELTGTPEGTKTGGILQTQVSQIEVEGLPNQLPSVITVDISNLQVGDTLTAGELTIPEGVALVSSPDELLVSIVPPRLDKDSEGNEDGSESGAEAAE